MLQGSQQPRLRSLLQIGDTTYAKYMILSYQPELVNARLRDFLAQGGGIFYSRYGYIHTLSVEGSFTIYGLAHSAHCTHMRELHQL